MLLPNQKSTSCLTLSLLPSSIKPAEHPRYTSATAPETAATALGLVCAGRVHLLQFSKLLVHAPPRWRLRRRLLLFLCSPFLIQPSICVRSWRESCSPFLMQPSICVRLWRESLEQPWNNALIPTCRLTARMEAWYRRKKTLLCYAAINFETSSWSLEKGEGRRRTSMVEKTDKSYWLSETCYQLWGFHLVSWTRVTGYLKPVTHLWESHHVSWTCCRPDEL